MSDQVTAKQNELEQMRTNTQVLLDKIEQLTTNLKQAQANKNVEAEQRIENLARENTALSQRILALEDLLKAQQENKPQPLSAPSMEDQERLASLTERVRLLEEENHDLQTLQNQLQTDLIALVQAGAEELFRTTSARLLDEISDLKSQIEEKQKENTYLIDRIKQEVSSRESLADDFDQNEQRLFEEITQLKGQASQQRAQFAKMQKSVDEFSAGNAGLEQENQALKQDKQALEAKLTEANSDISLLKARVEVLSNQADAAVQNSAETKRLTGNKWIKERDGLVEELFSVREALEQSESGYSALEQNYKQLQAFYQGLKEELRNINHEIQKHVNKQSDLENALREKNTQISNLEGRLKDQDTLQQASQQNLERKLAEAKSQKADLESQLKESQANVEQFKTQFEETQQQLIAAKELAVATADDVAEFRKQVAQRDSEIGKLSTEKARLERSITNLETEKQELKNHLQNAGKKQSSFEKQIELMDRDLQKARAEKVVSEKRIEELAAKVDVLSKELLATEDKLLAQQEVFQAKEVGLQSEMHVLQDENDQLKSQVTESRLQNKRLAEESDANTAELEREIQQQRKRIKVQDDQLTRTQEELQRTQAEKSALEEQFETSESENRVLTTALVDAKKTIAEQKDNIEILRNESPAADKKDKNKPLINNVVDNPMLLELSELKKQNESLQSERDDLARKINHLQNDLDDMNTSPTIVRSQIGEGASLSLADEFAFGKSQQMFQQAKLEAEQSEKAIKGLQTKLEQVDQARVKAEQKQSELEENIFEKDAQIENLTGFNVILKQRVKTLQTTLEQAQEGVGQAKVNAIKQERQLQEANEAFAQANADKVKAEADAKAKGDVLKQAQEAVQKAQVEKDSLEQQIQRLQNSFQQTQAKITEQERQLNKAYGIERGLHAQLDAKQTTLKSLEDEIKELKDKKIKLADQLGGLQDNLQQAQATNQRLIAELERANEANVKAEADAKAKEEALQQAKSQVKQLQDAFEGSQTALQQEQAKVVALRGALAEKDRQLLRLKEQQRNLQNTKENLGADNPVLSHQSMGGLAPEKTQKRPYSTDRENLKGKPSMPLKRKMFRLSDASNKYGAEEFAETEPGRSLQDQLKLGSPEFIELTPFGRKNSVSSHFDSGASGMNSSSTSTPSLTEEDKHEPLIAKIVKKKLEEMKKTDPSLSLTDQDLDDVIKIVLSGTNADIHPDQVEGIVSDTLAQFKTAKVQKIDQILESLTLQVVNSKLLEIARSAFLEKLQSAGDSAVINPSHVVMALQNLDEQVGLSDKDLAIFKEQLRRRLNSRSLATLNKLENNAAMEALLSIECNRSTTLKGLAEETAVAHAQVYLNHFQAAAAKTHQVFERAAQEIIANRQGALSLAIDANTLAKKTMQSPATKPFVSALRDRVLEIRQANSLNEQQARSQISDYFAENKDAINAAVEKTLTELEAKEKGKQAKQEAHEKDKQAKQAIIDRVFDKIDCAQVSKALVDYAKPILIDKLAEEGYLLNRLTDKQLKQKLYNLKPSVLEAVKQQLAATLIEERSIEEISTLAGCPDQVIEKLIHTQINPNSLAKQAENVAIDFAKQEIDSYKDKTPQDLANYYQATADFIENSAERLHLTMEDVATSREIRDFAREDKLSLESILTLINNGKFAEKKQELQEKLNERGLTPKDKKSYEQAIKSIEGVCSQTEAIVARITPLLMLEKALSAIIDKNDPDPKQAIVKVESPAHCLKVTKTPEELARARQEFFNKLSPEIGNTPYAALSDYKRTHTTVEFDTGSTLLEAIRVKTSRNLFKFKKEGEITLAYKAVKKEHVIEFSVDSVNADGRPTFIKKNIKNMDFVRSSTQSMLELAQGTGEGPENKGVGILVLNTNDPNWKERYAIIKAHEKLFPQTTPVLLKDPRRLSDKSIKAELKQLEAKFIKEYETLAARDKHIDGANTQTTLIGGLGSRSLGFSSRGL
ncbi:chromosome segregation ATPase-like protein [Candidatus Rickettsiella viridis]|uniref:Chromosome segregation ATPase-like protein n=1 Tax=Candidatus Rickettsiella viridis TaxID=676208 RepID=A0A2Z5UVL2_9COXI|nr:chromosome segregation ATPase-like protein [Candidatus Rickettsiella viridis]